jgi:hypothetical protein
MFFISLRTIAIEFAVDRNAPRYSMCQWIVGSPIYARAVLATLIQDGLISYEMPQNMIELYIANFSIYWNGAIFYHDLKRREHEYNKFVNMQHNLVQNSKLLFYSYNT